MEEHSNNGHGSWFTGLLGRLESAWTDLGVADAYVEHQLQLMGSNISNFYWDFAEELMSSSLFSSAFEQPEDGIDSAPGASDQTDIVDHQLNEAEQHSCPADASTEETSCASNSSGLERENTSQEILGSSTGSTAGAFAGFSHITDMTDAGITLAVSTEEDIGEHSEESSQGLAEPIGFFDSKEMLSSSEPAPDVETAGNNVPEMETGNNSDEISDGSDALRHDIKLKSFSGLGSSAIETTKPSDGTKLKESFVMVKCYGDCSIHNGKPRRRFIKANIGATTASKDFPMKNGRGDEQNPAGAKSDEPMAFDRNMQSLPLHSAAEDWELSDSEWEII